MGWRIVGRPGQTGFKKDEINAGLNSQYGEGNWRRMWAYEDRELSQQQAFLICEEAYFVDSQRRTEAWQRLLSEARDIYDMVSEEVESGIDYTKQHKFTRFHDICIRRVIARRALIFRGEELIQLRFDKDKPTWHSENFDPGKVPFHKPEKILSPHVGGWWNNNSVEDFYQSNKVLQVKE